MLVVFISQLKRKVMFALRMLLVLAILAVLYGQIYGLLKPGGSLNHSRPSYPDSPLRVEEKSGFVSNPATGSVDLNRGTIMDRLLQFLREYYLGRVNFIGK